jgi:hypothetical protein
MATWGNLRSPLTGGVWLSLISVMSLAACGSSTSPTNAFPDSVQSPTTINLYPVRSTADEDRLFVFVTAVGSTPVRMPLAFDTGSAGITLYALDIFPKNIVTADGFAFPPGQSTINYGGITVANQQGVRTYGGTGGKSEIGNIGYAQVTFGDGNGELTTAFMPIFLFYLITDNATGDPVPAPPQRGWFGVNDTAGLIDGGTPEPQTGYPACAEDTIGSCYVVSVLKYFEYATGLNAGFMVVPAPLQPCEITIPGNCSPAPMLIVGLTATDEGAFSEVELTCPPSGYSGPPSINGYDVCTEGIPDTTVTLSVVSTGMFTGTVLFDSGTPYIIFYPAKGSRFPSSVLAGTSVMVGTPSGFDYIFTAGPVYSLSMTPAPNSVETISDSTSQSIIGVDYFTRDSFFIDFTSHTEGWQ